MALTVEAYSNSEPHVVRGTSLNPFAAKAVA